MAKLRITYPYLEWQIVNVEVPEEQAVEILDMDLEQKAGFIEAQIKKEQIPYRPYSLEAALDTGYAHIKRMTNEADP